MKKYPKYKKTNIEWIGEIPESWEVNRLKYISDFQEGPGIMAKDFRETGVPLIRISGVKSKIVSLIGCNYLDDSLVNGKLNHFKVKKDDLIISGSATTGLISRVGEDTVGSILYTGLIRFMPTKDIGINYLEKILGSNIFNNQLNIQKTGTAIQHFGPSHLSNVLLPVPPKSEQTAIASYLDNKTSLIDKLIEKNEKLIKLLDEKRKATINQAVTKGLDPNVKMKDSGVEWIGKIPKHWKIIKLKYIVSFNDDVLGEKTNPEYEFKYIDIGSVNSLGQIEEKQSMLFQDSPSRARRVVQDGDVIVSTVRTYLRAIAHIDDNTSNSIVSTGFAVIRPKGAISSEYLHHFTRSEYFIEKVVSISKGISYPATTPTELAAIQVVIPTNIEQLDIVSYLNRETAKTDGLINKIKKQNILLKEYRQALISTVVTGKIDVRNEKIPNNY